MGDAVLLRGVDDSDSVGYAVRGRGKMRVFGCNFSVLDLVGTPYGQVFEVPAKGAPVPVDGPLMPRLDFEDADAADTAGGAVADALPASSSSSSSSAGAAASEAASAAGYGGVTAGGVDNRHIKGTGEAQSLSTAEVESLKASGVSGADMVSLVAKSSSTFAAKTELSRKKWLKAKKGRWLRRFQLLPASAHDVASALHAKHESVARPGSTAVRSDSLSLALALADVRSGATVLVSDDAGGSVAAAVWRRLAAAGRLVIVHSAAKPWLPALDVVGSGRPINASRGETDAGQKGDTDSRDGKAGSADASRAGDTITPPSALAGDDGSVLPWRRHPRIAVVTWDDLAAIAPDGCLVAPGPAVALPAETETSPANSSSGGSAAKRPRAESGDEPASSGAVADATLAPAAKRAHLAGETAADEAEESGKVAGSAPSSAAAALESPTRADLHDWLATGVDSVVMALSTDPLHPCLAASRLLRPGGCMAVHGACPGPLARAAAALRDNGLCRDVTLRTMFLRQMQVQPRATRPPMIMHTAPGYLLAGMAGTHPYLAVRPSMADVAAVAAPRRRPPSTAPVTLSHIPMQ
ncbi:hypothetical protein FNF29_04854 [Cafeteria roenbergensis]|uniref:tRNA (adenine(58)-N(1))-methyltransferase non-catalytic subunit TRM6 n=1 Tax=Cafeteria roenbergensis TaxID=33653 RepID=A0A5A8DDI1_CAFRO|nr:hypothetical protein FNF29_04854 [Cafeteria roenbergensis]KAA0163268.1 hypothetical protein FNF28_04327 [Cafeteria roenbergensis]|eukprot:KAA0150964.1 hypothetical protein FNF29_04854 [Cafeteria roenbergensis]